LTPPEAVAEYLTQYSGITWGRVDESFIAYDQPFVMIFRNVANLSAEEMAAQFNK
jgi:hypothetical protein